MVDFNKHRWTPAKNHSIPFERPTETEQHKDATNDLPPWHEWPDDEETDSVELTVNYVREQIRLITETVRKANRQPEMLNRSKGHTNKSKKKNGLPWLDVNDLPRDKVRMRIEWAGEPSEADAPDWGVVTLKLEYVEIRGKKVLWTLSDNNPCLDYLENELGSEEKDWAGREVFVWKEKVGIAEKEYIRVEIAATEASAAPESTGTRARNR